jgi:hypothetical protein
MMIGCVAVGDDSMQVDVCQLLPVCLAILMEDSDALEKPERDLDGCTVFYLAHYGVVVIKTVTDIGLASIGI